MRRRKGTEPWLCMVVFRRLRLLIGGNEIGEERFFAPQGVDW